MITKLIHSIFRTDSFPIMGGATGALTQVNNIMVPTFETVIYTIIIAIIGALTGYGIKLILDFIIKKYKGEK